MLIHLSARVSAWPRHPVLLFGLSVFIASDRLYEAWRQKQYILLLMLMWVLWAFLFDWFSSCFMARRKQYGFSQLQMLSCCQGEILWGTDSIFHAITRNLCVCILYIPGRYSSGESFCSWRQICNLPGCSSLTIEHLHLHLNAVLGWITSTPVSPLNQWVSFSSLDFICVMLILLFQVIFPGHAGFHLFADEMAVENKCMVLLHSLSSV